MMDLKKNAQRYNKDKNISVHSLRSAYVSHYFNKLNKLQSERVAVLMRSSVSTLYPLFFKKNDVSLMVNEPEEPEPKQKQEIIIKLLKL
jgi:hypothetical protein